MLNRIVMTVYALIFSVWTTSVFAAPPSGVQGNVTVVNDSSNAIPVTGDVSASVEGEVEVSGSVDVESLPQSLIDKIDALVAASVARKIPVRCSGFAREGDRDSFAARLTCRLRGLEQTSFTEVPVGKYVALTDVTISATNIASVDQRYNLSIGAGTNFGPGGSGARFIGTTDAGSRSHFTTPFVIATEGKSILVNNFARTGEPAFEGMDADVEVFGYIADIDTLGY
jgi:hypothetical protein